MKCKIMKPIDIDVKWLDVYPGGRVYPEDFEIGDRTFIEWDDIKKEYPELFDQSNGEFMLRIDVNTGNVYNWPANVDGYFRTVKVVDEGEYVLRDENCNEIHTANYCYVPECLQIEDNGYGDYFEFTINEDGYINKWKFTQNDVDELMGVDEEE